MRTRCGFDIVTTSIRRRTYKDSTRIRRGFDVIDPTSNPRRNDKDFDVEPIRIRRGFDEDSTLSIRRRILVEMIRISMSIRRRTYKDSTRIRRYRFDVEFSSKR